MSKAGFNGVMLANQLDNFGMLRGRSVLDATVAVLPREVAYAYRNRQVVSKRWLPMPWLVSLHEAIEKITGGGVSLSRQLGACEVATCGGRLRRRAR